MVDAISAFNANKPTNPKTDLTINWNKLTVDEINEYEEQGQEVPEYIKKWAEYVENLANVPDDVTYESYATDNAGVSNYALNGGLFGDYSSAEKDIYKQLGQDTINNIKTMAAQLEQIMDEAEKEVGEAESSKDGIVDRIQTLQTRASQLKDDKKNPLAPMEIIDINNQIKLAGEGGLTTMDMRLISLENIGGTVEDAYEMIRGAKGLASTLTSYSGNPIFGNILIKQYSKELEELSKEHTRNFKSASEEQDQNIETVGGYKSDVGNSANQFIPPGSETNISSDTTNTGTDGSDNTSTASASAKADEKAAETKKKQAQSTQKTKEEKTKTLAEEKILTDPNEILKRKMKRGEA